jgi:sialic acid synthase SpsE
MVKEAAKCGINAVKFQTFTADEIAAPGVHLPPRGHNLTHDEWLDRQQVRTFRDLFEKSGLPREWHKEMKRIAEDNGVEFISTPFSVDAAKFLVEEVGVRILKIASGDLTYVPLLEYAASTDCEIILSTGGAWPHEVHTALREGLGKRMEFWHGCPSSWHATKLNVLQCVSIYPCPDDQASIGVIKRWQDEMPVGCGIGYSDHTLSYEVPMLAVALGATIIEKHYKLTETDLSIDADHAMAQVGFMHMVGKIRLTPVIIGDGLKKPKPGEMHDREWARRDPSDWLRPTAHAREGNWE